MGRGRQVWVVYVADRPMCGVVENSPGRMEIADSKRASGEWVDGQGGDMGGVGGGRW